MQIIDQQNLNALCKLALLLKELRQQQKRLTSDIQPMANAIITGSNKGLSPEQAETVFLIRESMDL